MSERLYNYDEIEFMNQFTDLANKIHKNSIEHGFWPKKLHVNRTEYIVDIDARNKGEMIALMHSELSECLEGIRKPHQDEHCSEFTSEEIELADCIIRILDYSAAYKLNLSEAILAKHEYNKTREFKHGKAF